VLFILGNGNDVIETRGKDLELLLTYLLFGDSTFASFINFSGVHRPFYGGKDTLVGQPTDETSVGGFLFTGGNFVPKVNVHILHGS
jgi:hypothetical protein